MKRQTSGAATIEDIAARAGVHAATVSRALRGIAGKVSAAKRDEIVRIAEQLGYQPNAIAASLRTRQSDVAAIVVPDLANPLFGPIVQGLEHALRERNMLCLVAQTPAGKAERRDLAVALANRHIAGLIVLAAESDDPMLLVARERKVPTVLVNRGSGDRHFSSVVNDDRESVRLVLEHLVELGHRHIAHIAGPAASSTGRARAQAFADYAKTLKVKRYPVETADSFTRAAGRDAALRLLQRQRPTAVFAANDLIALGCLDVLRQMNLRVPRHVSLVGHNDMPLVDLVDPPLTTVRLPVSQMSQQAASLFIDLLRDPEQAPSVRLLTPSLIVRASTSEAPA
jgi:LacI family transcriptional regulator